MITLGLDPSLTGFGWCIHNSSVVGKGRVFAKGRWETSSKTMWVKRNCDLREQVAALLDRYVFVEAVGVESPTQGEIWSADAHALFLVVNEAIWSRRKDVVHFDPLTLKMLVKEDPTIRRGKMFKSDMIDAAKADTGVGRWNSDEADAYHVARYAGRFWALFNGTIVEEDLTPSEQRAFTKIHTFVRGNRAGQTVKQGAIFKEDQRFFRFSQWETSK